MAALKHQDDKNARLEKIFRDNLPDMYAFAMSLTHNKEMADEVIQSASLKFLLLFDEKSHIPDEKLRVYLFEIIDTKSNWRDNKRRQTLFARNIIYFEPETLPLEDYVFGELDAEIISECIQELPEEYAKFLRLSDDPYITPNMLAELLEVKPSSLRMIRSRARKLLKEACRAKGVEVEIRGKRSKK